MDRQCGTRGGGAVTAGQIRQLLKVAADLLARAAPILVAIADLLSRRTKPKPPQH
jgi:hypothetical protein